MKGKRKNCQTARSSASPAPLPTMPWPFAITKKFLQKQINDGEVGKAKLHAVGTCQSLREAKRPKEMLENVNFVL